MNYYSKKTLESFTFGQAERPHTFFVETDKPRGYTRREIALDERGNIVHKFPSEYFKNGERGIYDCCPLEDFDDDFEDISKETFEKKWEKAVDTEKRIASSQPKYEYNQARGWLLLVCLSLTFLNPLLFYNFFITRYEQINTFFTNQIPPTTLTYKIDLVITILFAITGFFAGIQLGKRRSYSLKLVKSYSILLAIYTVIITFILINLGLSPKMPGTADDVVLATTLLPLLYCAALLLYLKYSSRVMETFKFTT